MILKFIVAQTEKDCLDSVSMYKGEIYTLNKVTPAKYQEFTTYVSIPYKSCFFFSQEYLNFLHKQKRIIILETKKEI